MIWYKRLRFRLFVSQFAVVIAGVMTMLVVLRNFIPVRLTTIIENQLSQLALPPELYRLMQTDLITSINQLILGAIGIAALIAFFVGILSSLLLWVIIITPIRDMANSSQRIASGRYDERVEVPNRAGEAMALMATNFNQMAGALESVEEQRIRLVGDMTHELRTPLSGLSGYVEGLSDGVFEPNEKLFQSMEKQIGRMKRLIDDTQFMSQAESGAVQLEYEKVNLTNMIDQVIFQLAPKQLEKNIQTSFLKPAEDVSVSADYDRLTQILTNLLSNGLQYTPPGGKIEIEVTAKNGKGEVTIRDSGIGIRAESLPFLFERFYRVDQSRSQEHGGSGVGLTISRHLARGMGGELVADSEGLGRGSTFTLQLPLDRTDG